MDFFWDSFILIIQFTYKTIDFDRKTWKTYCTLKISYQFSVQQELPKQFEKLTGRDTKLDAMCRTCCVMQSSYCRRSFSEPAMTA